MLLAQQVVKCKRSVTVLSLPSVQFQLMRIAGYNRSGIPDKEIKVGTFISLLHVALVHGHVPPIGMISRLFPQQSPSFKFYLVNQQVYSPCLYIQAYHISVFYKRQVAANGRFW